MAFDPSLSTLKAKLGTPAKINRFYADFPALGNNEEDDMAYFIQSIATPVKTTEEIIINWQGVQYKVPGDSTVSTVTITFRIDGAMKSYNYCQLWQSLVIDTLTNSRGAIGDVKKNLDLHQLGDNASILATWEFLGMFITEVGEIAYDQDSPSTISTFTATFALDDFAYKSKVI